MRLKPLIINMIVLCMILMISACSSGSVVTMKDGREIRAKKEPKYNKRTGFYEFQEHRGKKIQVNEDEISTIRKR